MASLDEIEQFEDENGVPYIDLFAEKDKDSIQGTGTSLDGKSVEDYAKSKGLGKAVADGVYGGIRSLINLATIPVYKTTSKIMTGDWGDFEKDAQKEFDRFLPPEVEPTTTGESIVQGLSKFATTTAVAGGVGKIAGLTGKGGAITNLTIKSWSKSKEGVQLGKILAPALNGMIGDATSFWQDKENLSSIIEKNSDNKYIKEIAGWLAIEKDDDAADRMLKQSLEGVLTAGAVSGIFKTLKGVKNYSKAAIEEAKLSKTAAQFGQEIEALSKTQKIVEKPERAEQIAKAVAEGKRIEPALKKEVQELGVVVPRNPEVISLEKAKESVAKRITELGWGEADILSEEQLKKLAKDAENQVEKVMPALENEEKVFLGGLVKMKKAGKDFAEGQITKDFRNKAFFDALKETADAFGVTQDMLYESGKALGYSSQKKSHSVIKDVLTTITDNADELTKDKIFDIFAGAGSVEELRAKLLKLGYMNPKELRAGIIRRGATIMTALEQAGLMNSFGTVFRNVFTSMEMAAENIAVKTVGGIYSAGDRAVRTLLKKGMPVSSIEFKEASKSLGAYVDSVVDMTSWFCERIKKWDWKNAPDSFVGQYRNSVSRKAMTNLPKEIGATFAHETKKGKISSFFNKLAESYVTYSGVNFSEKIDNFFEATFFRGEARSRALEYAERIGREKGLSSKKVTELYNSIIDKVSGIDLTERKNLSKLVDDALSDNLVEYSIAKKAREKAAEMTFRSGRGKITNWVSDIISATPIARPFIPFFKTGSTIFFDRFLGDLTPAGLFKFVSPQFRAMMKKGGREAQEYWTKMAIGGGIMFTGYNLAMNGKITGDYSSDPKVRNAQIAAGWQPNSLVFEDENGKKTYLSIDNLGPLSMALSFPAKLYSAYADYRNKLELPEEDYKTEEAIAAMSIAFAKEAFDQSALRYFANGFKLFNQSRSEKEFLEKLGELAYSPLINVIPRGIGEINQVVNSDAIKQGAEGFIDEAKKRLGMNTFDTHDVFGNPVQDQHPWYSLAGVKTKESRDDDWLDYLAEIGVGFEMPRKSIVVDKVKLEINERQADGIRQEMANMNAEKYIKNIAEGKKFKSLPKEIQKQLINTQFGSLREAAIMRYFGKDTELQKQRIDAIKRIPKKYVPSLDVGK